MGRSIVKNGSLVTSTVSGSYTDENRPDAATAVDPRPDDMKNVVRSPHSGRLALLTLVVAGLGAVGCASAPPVGTRPSPFPGVPDPAWASRRPPEEAVGVQGVLDLALSMRGVPYLFGGASPETGFDCSGLVRYVFRHAELDVPRTVAEQFLEGQTVARGRIDVGDLLFFSTTGPGATHVGIVVDPGARTFVHAPGTGAVVRVERYDTPYWQRRLLGARRLSLQPTATF